MLRLPDEEGDERSGVGDDDFSHWPKSSRYLGLVAMSRGPRRQPAKSLARSRHDDAYPFSGVMSIFSTHSRTTADLEVRRRCASSANRESSVSGTLSEIVVMAPMVIRALHSGNTRVETSGLTQSAITRQMPSSRASHV
jgi:hypothetical protein